MCYYDKGANSVKDGCNSISEKLCDIFFEKSGKKYHLKKGFTLSTDVFEKEKNDGNCS